MYRDAGMQRLSNRDLGTVTYHFAIQAQTYRVVTVERGVIGADIQPVRRQSWLLQVMALAGDRDGAFFGSVPRKHDSFARAGQ